MVGEELAAMKQKYGDNRRTLIIRLKEGATVASMLTTTDMTPDQAVWIGVSANGAISRTTEDSLQAFLDHRAPRWLLEATTHNTLYLVSDKGKAAAIPVHAIPEYGKNPEGVSVIKLSPLEEGDRMAAMFTLPPRVEGNGGEGGQYVVSVTRAGLVKKSATSELPGPAGAHVHAEQNQRWGYAGRRPAHGWESRAGAGDDPGDGDPVQRGGYPADGTGRGWRRRDQAGCRG